MNHECAKTLLKNVFDGYSGEKYDLIRVMNDLYDKSLQHVQDEILVQDAPAEESKNFSEDGKEAVKEMMKYLEGKYDIKSYSEKGTKDAYFRITNKEKSVIIENHDTYTRNDFGLITTEDIKYSDEGSTIIGKWKGFGRTLKRKQYYFKGKDIIQTLSTIDKLLS